MESNQTLENKLGDFLNLIGTGLQQQTTPSSELETIIKAIEAQVLQAEQELAGQNEQTLSQTQGQLSNQQHQLEDKLKAARELGLPNIQAKIQDLQKMYDDLVAQDLETIQKSLSDFKVEAQAHLKAQAEAGANCSDYQKQLDDLAREAKDLARREQMAQQSLEKWDQKRKPRILRQQCLETARQIHKLRQTLQQQLTAVNTK